MSALEKIGIIVGILASLPLIFEYYLPRLNFLKINLFNRKTTSINAHEMCVAFFDKDKWKEMPDYLLESTYRAMTGTQLHASEIRFLLSLKDPMSKCQHYGDCRTFLTVKQDETGREQITLKEDITKILKLILRGLFIFFYIVFVVLAIVPIMMFDTVLQKAGETAFIILPIWFILMGICGIFFLNLGSNLTLAERIVAEKWHELKKTIKPEH